LTNVICYIRTSAKEEDITRQEALVTKYCNDNFYTIVYIYRDSVESGTNFQRSQYQAMINDLQKGTWQNLQYLIVEHMDRLSRVEPLDYILCLRTLMQYISIYSLMEGPIQNETLEDELVNYIKAYASHKRVIIDREKQRSGMVKYRKKHGRWGRRKKKLNLKQYHEYKDLGISKTNIARLLGMSLKTLNKRLEELEE